MVTSNLLKVVAAFVAGVVVALGSALIYVRVTDMVHPRPAQALLSTPPPVSDTVLPATASDTRTADAPAHPTQSPPERSRTAAAPVLTRKVSAQKPRAAMPRTSAPSPSQVDTSKYEPHEDAVNIAQNRLPANLPTAAPPPSTNDSAAPVPPPESQPAPLPVRQPNVVTLQPGTVLDVRLGETLSTEHNYTGDTFRAMLQTPIIVDGFIIADKGSKVLGRVVNSEKGGRMEGTAGLTVALTEINTTDGQRVKIETNSVIRRGPSNTGEDAAKIAGGAALGAIIGAIAGGGKGAAIGAGAGGAAGTGAVLLSQGKPATLSTETRLNFRLANPVTITEKLNY